MADAAESTKQMGELEAQLQSMAEAIGKLTKEQVILTSGTEKWRANLKWLKPGSLFVRVLPTIIPCLVLLICLLTSIMLRVR